MFGLSFLNPWLLLGTAAGSAPIIIHLLNRRRFKIVVWAAMEFLLASSRKNFRRVKLEQLILMAIRVLLLVLLALAVSRPFLKKGGLGALLGESSRYAILIVDTSFSMHYESEGRPLFERAKAFGQRVLDTLREGDTVSLIAMSDRPHPIIHEPSFNIDLAKAELEALQPSHSGTSIPAALKMAHEMIERAKSAKCEVYLLTDSQRTAWQLRKDERAPQFRETAKKLRERAPVFLIDVGVDDAANCAVTQLHAAEQVLSTNLAATFAAEITNFGREAVAGRTVNFLVDGYRQESQTVDLAAGKATPVQFSYTFSDDTPHYLTVQLDRDGLNPDDQRRLSVSPLEQISVLIVNGEPDPQPFLNETDFLSYALRPLGDRLIEKTSIIAPEAMTEMSFRNVDLQNYQVVVFANLATVDDRMVENLVTYVSDGGSLLIFLGDRVDPLFYNEKFFAAGKGLLPARLDRPVGDLAGESRFFLSPERYDHPILKLFEGVKNSSLSSGHVYRYYALEPDEASEDVSVVCRLNNRAPAIVEKRLGHGTVLLMATTCDAEWTNLPAKPAFLPLFHETIYYLTRDTGARRNVLVGQRLEKILMPDQHAQPFALQPPGRKASVPLIPVAHGNRFLLGYDDTDTAGVYRLGLGHDRPGAELEPVDYLVVNVDTRESDLEHLAESQIREALPELRFRYVTDPRKLRTEQKQSSVGRELWRSLLYAVLALACLESVLAQRFGR